MNQANNKPRDQEGIEAWHIADFVDASKHLVWKKMDPMLLAGGPFQILIFLWLGFQGGWFAVLLFGVCAKPSRPGQQGVVANDDTPLLSNSFTTPKSKIQQNALAHWRIYIHISVVLYIHVYMYVIDILIVPGKKEPCNNMFSCANQFFSNAGMFCTFLLPYLLALESLFESLEWAGHAESQGYFYSCLGLLLDRCGYISNQTPSELSQSVWYTCVFFTKIHILF